MCLQQFVCFFLFFLLNETILLTAPHDVDKCLKCIFRIKYFMKQSLCSFNFTGEHAITVTHTSNHSATFSFLLVFSLGDWVIENMLLIGELFVALCTPLFCLQTRSYSLSGICWARITWDGVWGHATDSDFPVRSAAASSIASTICRSI